MIRGLIVVLLITFGNCADHGTFRNCSRVDFCTNLRTRQPSDVYTISSESVQVEDGSNVLTAILTSSGNSDLTLTLTGLQQDTFRLKITEVNSTRYALQDVLDGEPESLNFDNVESGDDSVTVTSGTNSVTITFSPFGIEFSKNGVAEVIFNGDRLTITRNDINAPFAFGITYPEAVQLYGLHEHCDSFALQNTSPDGIDPYRLKNSDVAYYEIASPMALYGAVPVLYGHGTTATAGIFLHNAAEQWIETTSQNGNTQAYFMAETGTLDVFVLLGPKPVDVVRQYTTLTGRAHLPQIWALGYHQSRYSYASQDDVIDVANNFDSAGFQLDAIWLDIDYTDGFKYFSWNPSNFSDPVSMQEALASTNKKLITIIDPHVKVESGYDVYDGALAGNLFVTNSDGTVYQGPSWPGISSYIDFLNPAAREYYGNFYSYENFPNSTSTLAGIWNDMNEPSVFDTSLEMTLPADSLHFGGIQHREIHNIYGLLHTMATHQGLLDRDNGTLRPFVLTRSHFAGSQRYAAIWTGDNTADWPYLLASIQQCLNANLLGIVFCGADIGGFFNEPNDELYQRWYQAGAWLPFFRAHSSNGVPRREPYLKSEDVQTVVRNAIQTRYQHLPVWYSLFYDHVRDGDPIIRPLFYHYPEDVNVFTIDNQFLVGRDILVRPITEANVSTVQVYFPGGPEEYWVAENSDAVYAGNGYADVDVDIQSIPIFYRGGSVVPRKNTVRSNTAAMVNDAFTVIAILNKSNTAYGRIYVDDNESFNYEDLDFSYWGITFSTKNGSNTVMLKYYCNVYQSKLTYGLTIGSMIYKYVTQEPKGLTPGVYKNFVINEDVYGTPLKDIKFHSKAKMSVDLKLPKI